MFGSGIRIISMGIWSQRADQLGKACTYFRRAQNCHLRIDNTWNHINDSALRCNDCEIMLDDRTVG